MAYHDFTIQQWFWTIHFSNTQSTLIIISLNISFSYHLILFFFSFCFLFIKCQISFFCVRKYFLFIKSYNTIYVILLVTLNNILKQPQPLILKYIVLDSLCVYVTTCATNTYIHTPHAHWLTDTSWSSAAADMHTHAWKME